jgi:ribosomal protein S17E
VNLLEKLEHQFKEDNKDVVGKMAEKEKNNRNVANGWLGSYLSEQFSFNIFLI